MAGDNGIYPYRPSKAACLIVGGLFGLSAAYHLFQLLRMKAWFYTSFVVGALSMPYLERLNTHMLNLASDDSRLHLSLYIRRIACKPYAIHRAVLVYHPTTFTLRRYYIHDIWPARHLCQRC